MITPTPKNIFIKDGNLVVHGRTILTAVPDNILVTSSDISDAGAGIVTSTGAFIGATSERAKSLHIFQVGALEGLRFMCLFRFKLWWMTQRMGTNGNDIPLETQFMLVESKDDQSATAPTIYTVFLPLLQGQFRAVLQGNQNNQMEICLESGDNSVSLQTTHDLFLLYIHAGTDPFQVIYQAVKAVEKHLQTFRHRDEKKLPSFLNWFGWCTWDAFYTDVTAEGVEQGLTSLSGGGFPPRFLIIDDGWQQVDNEGNDDSNCIVQGGEHFTDRLTDIKENEKFQKPSLKVVVEKAKKNHNVKYVYLWHALAGYWSGVNPAAIGMEQFEPTIAYPIQSPGVLGNQPDVVMDILAVHGLGIVHPKKVFSLYNELHGYLASCGVDGVKVDVQNIIETLGAGHGGRVSLTRDYLQALEASIEKNFTDNGCIACMSHNTDGIYSSKQTAVVRASDDFYPRDPASHTMHVASVAYNSVFLGEFMQPDWDMFHSLHPAAEYHAAARAVGGCPIYVSDKPGNHNFDLLKKLVLPDGSVLRGELPGRPTLDCLFVDPTRDGKSLLKIWNANKCSGVVGVFNCQGAGWCKIAKKILIHNTSPEKLTGYVKAEDVTVLSQIAGANWNGDSVVFAHKSGEVIRLQKGESLPVTLKVLEHEVFHFCPLKEISKCVFFAPVGLLDMFNSGGAVEEFDYHANPVSVSINQQETWTKTVALTVKGCGRWGAYSSRSPHKCSVDGVETSFEYYADRGLLTLSIPIPIEEMYRWKVEIEIEVEV